MGCISCLSGEIIGPSRAQREETFEMTDTTSSQKLIASTVASLPGSAAERFTSNLAARYKRAGDWRELTYGEAGEAIEESALGLISLGIEPGDRVGVLADTRLEWTLA